MFHLFWYLVHAPRPEMPSIAESILELHDVTLPVEAGLVDVGSRLRDHLDVVALDDELILDLLGSVDGDTLEHLHNTHALLAQEVANLHDLAAVLYGYVDGEVSVHEPHGVPEAPGDAKDHVADVTDARPRAGQAL